MKKSKNMLVWRSKMLLAQQFCTVCSGWQKPLEKASYQGASITSNNVIGNIGHSAGVMYEISKVRIA
jgi:hypothetical protein